MKPKLLKTKADHRAALARIDALMEAAPGSPNEEELELWSLLVDRYEEERFRIDPPDPVDAIRFRMEQRGMQPADLRQFLGGKSRVSEVLNHKRPLSIAMIRALHAGLGIPAEVLVQEGQASYPGGGRA
jgi:HTH-type transcriptional regulator/antitoxin HigA